jgi:hypothetical protein
VYPARSATLQLLLLAHEASGTGKQGVTPEMGGLEHAAWLLRARSCLMAADGLCSLAPRAWPARFRPLARLVSAPH